MELCQQTSERMVLSCEISRPNAVVRWYRDGLEVEENDNLILEVDGVYRRLIIPETTVKDSAEYVCDTADDSVTFIVNIAGKKLESRKEKKEKRRSCLGVSVLISYLNKVLLKHRASCSLHTSTEDGKQSRETGWGESGPGLRGFKTKCQSDLEEEWGRSRRLQKYNDLGGWRHASVNLSLPHSGGCWAICLRCKRRCDGLQCQSAR